MRRVYEGVEFVGDDTTVNPNIIGEARQIVEIVYEPVATIDPAVKRQIEIAAMSGADVSPQLLRKAGITANGRPIEQTRDVTA